MAIGNQETEIDTTAGLDPKRLEFQDLGRRILALETGEGSGDEDPTNEPIILHKLLERYEVLKRELDQQSTV